MKKKGTILAGLLLATIVTGYSVAGTYAKYTSAIDLTDEARVAKWSFALKDANTDGHDGAHKLNLFSSSYYPNGDDTKKVYVRALNNTDQVVAPGTLGMAEFQLDGAIETAFTVDYNIKAENDFIVYYKTVDNKVTEMKTAKQLADAGVTDTSDYEEYRPLTYTITHTRNGEAVEEINNVLKGVTTDKLAAAFKIYNDKNADGTHIFTPGTYTFNFKIEWKWAANNTVGTLGETEVNRLDTFAGENLSEEADKINFDINIVAKQWTEDNSQKAA